MELTPNDVEQKAFTQALRGYQMDEVDDFLDEIVATLRAVDQRLRDAQDKIRALESEAVSRGGDETTISRAILVAQRSADALLVDARVEADKIRQTAVAETESLSAERDQERARLQGEIKSMRDRVSGLRQTLATLASAVGDQVGEMEAGLSSTESELSSTSNMEDTTELRPISPASSGSSGSSTGSASSIREEIASIFPSASDEDDENDEVDRSQDSTVPASIDLDEVTGDDDPDDDDPDEDSV